MRNYYLLQYKITYSFIYNYVKHKGEIISLKHVFRMLTLTLSHFTKSKKPHYFPFKKK